MLRRAAVIVVRETLRLTRRPRAAGPVIGPEAAATAEPLRRAVVQSAAPRAVARWRTRLTSLAVAAGLTVFGLLGWLVSGGQTSAPDLTLTSGVQQAEHPLLAAVMMLISAPGFPPLNLLVVGGAAAFFWLAGYRTEGAFAALAGLGAAALASFLKAFWLRPRPDDELVQVIGSAPGTSFPSGHTLFYVGFFGFLFYWVYAALRPSRLRTVLLALLGLLVVLVGPSRVYLGHHWSSDVLAAYALGFAYLLVLIRLYSARRLSSPASATS